MQRRSCRARFLEGELEPLFDDRAAAPARRGGEPGPEGRASRPSARAVGDWLAARLGALLGGATALDRLRPLAELGLGSRDLVSLSGELSAWLGRPLPSTLFWEHPSIESVARHLAGEPPTDATPGEPPTDATPGERAGEAGRPPTQEPIAVIGLGCRFPGAAGPDAFWALVRQGASAITEVPPERWPAAAHFDPDPDAPGKSVTRWGGFLERIDGFDAHFFGISPREASEMDPQQRLLLEVSWEALEHAGIAPDALSGSRTGVFLGLGASEYGPLRAGALERVGPYSGTGSMPSVAAGRLSYVLGLQGPSLVVDTACSSSLTALHLACRSLAERECDLALVGGANALLSPEAMVALSKLRAMSPTGLCRPFDAAADGYVRGEGCGVVALKRLSDAEAANDRVLAVIRGTALNNDGRSNGLTAPNGLAQEGVIRQALARASVRPSEIGYVEAHGTGTPLGDPVEVRSLARVLAEGRRPDEPAVLGSVKANIGHLEAAAGIAGLIKAVLVLAHAELPPQPRFERPNPHLPWASLPVRVATELTPWPSAGREKGPARRIAGVSAFGFSGTNVHVVLESPPEAPPIESAPRQPWHLLLLSARSEGALAALARSYQGVVAKAGPEELAEICFTARAGRAHFEHRLAVVARTSGEAAEALAEVAAGQASRRLMRGRATQGRAPKVAFLFTGQGALEAGAGRELYEGSDVFRGALERCDELLRPRSGRPLRDVLYPAPGAPELLADARYAQPALFALQYALVELWRSWGVEPAAVFGHSLGEYAAAWAAGVLALPDALALVVERARLRHDLGAGGAMAAVMADEARVAPVLAAHAGRLALA
ncbi:MAG TPA: beta-ketoacyl synthase N-terminal-like domain-containing protein, partial [Polyangiaceae bacterium]|nr:beta-ketoacyl synthase N-terminal-like domain-containing protein [Polyangiaceae bacterium]